MVFLTDFSCVDNFLSQKAQIYSDVDNFLSQISQISQTYFGFSLTDFTDLHRRR